MKSWKLFMIGALLWESIAGIHPAIAGQPSVCGGEQEASAIGKVADVFVQDGKLVASVAWSSRAPAATQATLEVLNRGGVVAASRTVTLQPGHRVDYQMTPGPSFFEAEGYWFSVRVVDVFGAPLTEPSPVLVTFCPADQGCVYEVVKGVGSVTLSTGSELFQAMEEQAGLGSSDLLHDVLRVRPELAHEVYWAADQIGRLVTASPAPECVCLWQAEYGLDPQDQDLWYLSGNLPPNFNEPDWETFSSRGPGSIFDLAGQMLDGEPLSLTAKTDARLALHLRCYSTPSWVPGSWAGLPIQVPSLKPCLSGCEDAQVTVVAQGESWAAASAVATSSHGARGQASAAAAFFLNGQPNPSFVAGASVEVDRLPGDSTLVEEQASSGPVGSTWTVLGASASAAFSADGDVGLCLAAHGSATSCPAAGFSRPADDSGPWAHGCASSQTEASLVATASCAWESPQAASLVVTGGPPLDGLLILPWRP